MINNAFKAFMHHHISRMFTTCGGSKREREEKFLSRSRSRRTELELNALSFVVHSLLFAAWFWKEKFFHAHFFRFFFVRSCSLEMKVTARNEQQQLFYIFICKKIVHLHALLLPMYNTLSQQSNRQLNIFLRRLVKWIDYLN